MTWMRFSIIILSIFGTEVMYQLSKSVYSIVYFLPKPAMATLHTHTHTRTPSVTLSVTVSHTLTARRILAQT